jgi:hypothetical protein
MDLAGIFDAGSVYMYSSCAATEYVVNKVIMKKIFFIKKKSLLCKREGFIN